MPVAEPQKELRFTRAGQAVPVDGGYGEQTKAAVKAWQQAHGLKPSGVVGLATWLSLL